MDTRLHPSTLAVRTAATKHPALFDFEALIREVERYLLAVDAFRAAGREPTWRAEFSSPPSVMQLSSAADSLRFDRG
jgi:hypothetical protein